MGTRKEVWLNPIYIKITCTNQFGYTTSDLNYSFSSLKSFKVVLKSSLQSEPITHTFTHPEFDLETKKSPSNKMNTNLLKKSLFFRYCETEQS